MKLRKHRRSPVQCPASFTDEAGSLAEGIAYNLSTGGCAIRCASNLAEGMSLSLLITLPGDEVPIIVESARVRWSAQEEFGVEFVAKQKAEEKRLAKFLTTQGRP